MQTAKKPFDAATQTDACPGFPARLADATVAATISPAAELQAQLGDAFAADFTGEERWSYRRTVAFLLVTCGSFWLCTAAFIARLL